MLKHVKIEPDISVEMVNKVNNVNWIILFNIAIFYQLEFQGPKGSQSSI